MAKSTTSRSKVDASIDLDKIAELLGVVKFDDLLTQNLDYIWDTWVQHAEENAGDGLDEEGLEAIRSDAEEEGAQYLLGKYHRALLNVAREVFEQHGLNLVPAKFVSKMEPTPMDYTVMPIESWVDAAKAIIETINGVGSFEYDNVKEFVHATSSKTPAQAVMSHLHWMKDRAEVFGTMHPDREFDELLDRYLRD